MCKKTFGRSATPSLRGFSLIEVMVAIALLALGLLAVGSLQLASQRSNQLSAHASAATTLARDFLELMRADAGVAGSVANPYLFDSDDPASHAALPAVDCRANPCTGAQMAALQVADWVARVRAQLPAGRAVTCRDASPREADGRARWACDGGGEGLAIKLGWTDRRDPEERGGAPLTVAADRPQLVLIGVMGAVE